MATDSTQQLTDDEIEKANQDALDQVNSLIGDAEELAESEEWPEVMSLCQQAIGISAQRLGPLHICTLWHIKKMGGYLREQGKYADAERVDRGLLVKWESKQPRDDLHEISVLDVLSNLVKDLKPQGLDDQVIDVQRQILQSVIRERGEDAPHTIPCKTKLANSLYCRGDYVESFRLHNEALTTLRLSCREETRDTAVLLDLSGVDCLALGDAERAQALQEEAVAVAGRVCGPHHDTTLQCVTNLSRTYCETGKAPADWIQRMEMLINESVQPRQEPNAVTANLLNALGNAYCDARRYHDAQHAYFKCHDWANKSLGCDHSFTRLCQDNLMLASTKTGDLVLAPILSSEVTGIPQ